MLFRMSNIFYLVLLTTVSKVLSVYFYRCYDDSNLPNILCLSTNTDSFETWLEANNGCYYNGSALIDVANETVQSILNRFRGESGSQLSNVGNWIVIHSRTPDSFFQWINESSGTWEFEVNDLDNPPTRVFVAIRNRNISGLPVYWAQTYYTSSSYICQFNELTRCVNGGGLIRNLACYKKYIDTMTWFEASNACLREGGSLAIFPDLWKPFMDADLTAWLNVTDAQSYWIGLVKPWWFRQTYTVIQYSNWHSPPSLKLLINRKQIWRETCVQTEPSTNEWLVFHCSQPQRFVCETTIQRTTTATDIPIVSAPSTSSMTTRPTQSSTITQAATECTTSGSNAPLIVGVIVGVGGALNIIVLVVNVLLILRWRKRTNGVQQTQGGGAPAVECIYVDQTQLADSQYDSLSNTNRSTPQITVYEKLDTSTHS